MLAVNFFLLARGGVAAGFVVQAARNHTADSEQEEGDGKHFAARSCGVRVAGAFWRSTAGEEGFLQVDA